MRVCAGVFEAVEGTILARRGIRRVMIAVDLAETGISLEIDESKVEVIG
ncbi:MAG TPA: hypothetical protein VG826_23160 [Pirellulales bacterium]|nr:hypothetical protein [Pirellulales bacterium]